MAFFSCYILFSAFSVAYAYRLNTRPGFSAELRSAFIVNHMLYVSIYILTWMPYLGVCFYVMFSLYTYYLLKKAEQ